MEMEKATRNCPYCGEEILEIARKCKHCGEWLTEKEQVHELHANQKPVLQSIDEKPHAIDRHSGFWEYYFFDLFIRHYADFKGKTGRKQFWIGYLCYTLFIAALACIDLTIGWLFISMLTGFVLFLIPVIAAVVRRLHDVGKSGWWFLIQYVPIIGFIWLFVLLCRKGERRAVPVVFHWSDYTAFAAVAFAIVFGIYIFSRDMKTFNRFASLQTGSVNITESVYSLKDKYTLITDTDDQYMSEEWVSAEDFDLIATYDDKERHCAYFTKQSDENILYKYDLKTQKIKPIDLTRIVCVGEKEPPMIYSIHQITAKDNRLIIIAGNGGCGMFAGEYLIVYNTFKEKFVNVDFGYVELIENNTKAKVRHKKLTKEGSCSAENEYEYTDVIYEL